MNNPNKALNKYWLKAGLLSFTERFSTLLFGFGSFFLLIRILPKEAFGVWIIFQTVTTILEVGKIGLLQNALVKFLTVAKDIEYKEISTASLVINVIIAALTSLFLIVASPFLGFWLDSEQLQYLLPIFSITTLVFIISHQSNFTQQAHLDFKGLFWSNFVRKGLFFLFILVHFVLPTADLSLMDLVIFQIFTTLAGSLTSLYFGRKYLQFSRYINWSRVYQLFQYGKFVMGTNLSTMLYKTIDKIMLSALLSPIAVAMYEAAVRINSLMEVPTFSVASVVFPESSRRTLTSSRAEIAMLYEKAVGATLTFILPAVAFIWIFAPWIIWIIAGDNYSEAVPLLRWTILYGLFVPFAIQFGTILDSNGHPRINFLFTLLGATLNILANYIAISIWGVSGAPIGTLVTYCLTFILMQQLLYRKYGVLTYRVFSYMIGFYLQVMRMLNNRLVRNSI